MKKVSALIVLILYGLSGSVGLAQTTRPHTMKIGQINWNLDEVLKKPRSWSAQGFSAPGVRGIFYEGLPFQGKPTWVFAWLGFPKDQTLGEKHPAIVLVHGGGGTAYDRWVRLWTSRGYVAIAMDVCGFTPDKRMAREGAAGQEITFSQLDLPIESQWPYHAVAAIGRANSLLRSLPQVDPEKIGITGVSWGGYLTCLALAVDHRFCFGVPIYGCGFLGEDSMWGRTFTHDLTPARSALWHEQWDPSIYLPLVKAPTLWITGVNDPAYPLGSWQKSIDAVRAPKILSLNPVMVHTQGDISEKPEAIQIFADSLTRGRKPLLQISPVSHTDQRASVSWGKKDIVHTAELVYTKGLSGWKERKWETIAIVINPKSKSAGVQIPQGTTAYFFRLKVKPDVFVTSNVEILKY